MFIPTDPESTMSPRDPDAADDDMDLEPDYSKPVAFKKSHIEDDKVITADVRQAEAILVEDSGKAVKTTTPMLVIANPPLTHQFPKEWEASLRQCAGDELAVLFSRIMPEEAATGQLISILKIYLDRREVR